MRHETSPGAKNNNEKQVLAKYLQSCCLTCKESMQLITYMYISNPGSGGHVGPLFTNRNYSGLLCLFIKIFCFEKFTPIWKKKIHARTSM